MSEENPKAVLLRMKAERDEALRQCEVLKSCSDEIIRIREYLGAMAEQDTFLLVKSVVKAKDKAVTARDEAQRQCETLKNPAPVPPGFSTDALSIGEVLSRAYNESPKDAAERVLKERNQAQQELDAIRAAVKHDSKKKKSLREAVQTLCQDLDEARATPRAMARALGLNEGISLQQMLLGCESQREAARQTRAALAEEQKAVTHLRGQLLAREAEDKQAKQKLIDAHERIALVLRMAESNDKTIAALREVLGHENVYIVEAARRVVQELQATRSVLGAKNNEAADAVALRMIKLGLDFKSERDAAKAAEFIDAKQRSETKHRAFEELDKARAHIAEISASLEKAVADRDALQKHNEHLLASVAHEQSLCSKALKELEDANLNLSGAARERDAWRELFEQVGSTLERTPYENVTDAAKRVAGERRYAIASLEKTLVERDALQQNLDAATQMLNDMNEAVQSVVKERDALLPRKYEGYDPMPELEGFRKGDLVRTPTQTEYVPIERIGVGHGGFWYVYVNGGGWEPQTLVRKPVYKGDKARCVRGPFEGETVRVVGVDKNYVEMIRKDQNRIHVIDLNQVVAVAS